MLLCTGCHGDIHPCLLLACALGHVIFNVTYFGLLFNSLFSSHSLEAFDGLGDVLMPAMAPQAMGASPMTTSPVKPMGDLDSVMANMASSTFPT